MVTTAQMPSKNLLKIERTYFIIVFIPVFSWLLPIPSFRKVQASVPAVTGRSKTTTHHRTHRQSFYALSSCGVFNLSDGNYFGVQGEKAQNWNILLMNVEYLQDKNFFILLLKP